MKFHRDDQQEKVKQKAFKSTDPRSVIFVVPHLNDTTKTFESKIIHFYLARNTPWLMPSNSKMNTNWISAVLQHILILFFVPWFQMSEYWRLCFSNQIVLDSG